MASAEFNIEMGDLGCINTGNVWQDESLDDLLLTINPNDLLTEDTNNQDKFQSQDNIGDETNQTIPDEDTGLTSDSDDETIPAKKMKNTKENLRSYVKGSRNKNTTEKTRRDTEKFKEYLLLDGELRKMEDIPPEELNVYLGGFIKDLKQQNGTEYEPDTVSSIFRSIDRHLKDLGYPASLKKDDAFQLARNVLISKRKELKAAGKGNKANRTLALSPTEEEKLWESGVMGPHAPMPLLRGIWYLMSKLMGFRGRQEVRQLRWGDVTICEDEHGRFLSFNERVTKTRQGETGDARDEAPKAYENLKNSDRCPVKLYELYTECRPKSTLEIGSPFFLGINRMATDPTKKASWFKKGAMGKNKLGDLMREMAKEIGLQGKYCNHTVRKTSLTNLLQAGCAPTVIKHISGHKSEQSIGHYATASKAQIKKMNDILLDPLGNVPKYGQMGSPNPVPGPSKICNSSDTSVKMEDGLKDKNTLSGLLHSATLSNCTFHISYNLENK